MNTEISIKLQKLLIQKGIDMPIKTTIVDIVMWLYKMHGIWITTRINGIDKTFDYSIHIVKTMDGSLNNIDRCGFKSPSEAYESAIEYCLNKLI